MSDSDTIAAIATAPGQGGIGIIRVSGNKALSIAESFLGKPPQARHAHYASFKDDTGDVIDQGILLYFKQPASFTGEDVIELQVHGGPAVLDRLLNTTIKMGCRQARAGEFSERAFLNDRIDLVQAEAIADLISAESEQAAKAAVHSLQGEFSRQVNELLDQLTNLRMHVEAALDFPEEEIDFLADDRIKDKLRTIIETVSNINAGCRQGRLLSEGLDIVITGLPNAGKSSLLNALAGFDSAIVSDMPGTTRDVIRERILLDGVPVHVVDTAGIRDAENTIEQEGIRRAKLAVDKADLVIRVVDATAESSDRINDEEILVINKIDISGDEPVREGRSVWVSASNNTGIDLLTQCLLESAGYDSASQSEGRFSARRRHTDAIRQIDEHLDHAGKALESGDGDILAEELRLAQLLLSGITGEFRADDLLGKIFSEFCIGK